MAEEIITDESLEDNQEVIDTDQIDTDEASQAASGDGMGDETPYTMDELLKLPYSMIDLKRVPPEHKPLVDKLARDYEGMQQDYTRKTMELAEEKRKIEDRTKEETYFTDNNKNTVFKEYLDNPIKITSEINTEISKLRRVPRQVNGEDNPQYDQAQQAIDYWNNLKDEFSLKRQLELEKRHDAKISSMNLSTLAGKDAQKLKDFAITTLGYTESDYKEFTSEKNPERAARFIKGIQKSFAIVSARKSADTKIIKDKPNKLTKPSGSAGAGGKGENLDNMTIDEFVKKRNEASMKR